MTVYEQVLEILAPFGFAENEDKPNTAVMTLRYAQCVATIKPRKDGSVYIKFSGSATVTPKSILYDLTKATHLRRISNRASVLRKKVLKAEENRRKHDVLKIENYTKIFNALVEERIAFGVNIRRIVGSHVAMVSYKGLDLRIYNANLHTEITVCGISRHIPLSLALDIIDILEKQKEEE